MSDPMAEPDRENVQMKVRVTEVKPKVSNQSIEIKMTTSYRLDKLEALSEAMMNAAGGTAEMSLIYVIEQTELFDEEDGDQPDLDGVE